jgi:hypothetical protein
MPQYADVAVERWQAFTEEIDHLAFADIAAERQPS